MLNETLRGEDAKGFCVFSRKLKTLASPSALDWLPEHDSKMLGGVVGEWNGKGSFYFQDSKLLLMLWFGWCGDIESSQTNTFFSFSFSTPFIYLFIFYH